MMPNKLPKSSTGYKNLSISLRNGLTFVLSCHESLHVYLNDISQELAVQKHDVLSRPLLCKAIRKRWEWHHRGKESLYPVNCYPRHWWRGIISGMIRGIKRPSWCSCNAIIVFGVYSFISDQKKKVQSHFPSLFLLLSRRHHQAIEVYTLYWTVGEDQRSSWWDLLLDSQNTKKKENEKEMNLSVGYLFLTSRDKNLIRTLWLWSEEQSSPSSCVSASR